MVGTVLSLLYDELVRIWCYRWTAIATAAVLLVVGAAFVLAAQPALAQKKYGPGVTDTEMLLTAPYSVLQTMLPPLPPPAP